MDKKIDFCTIAVASDHAGVNLKAYLIIYLKSLGLEVKDFGPSDPNVSVDYPDYAYKVADAVATGACKYGIVICGSGIGVSIAANRNPLIRAALCVNPNMAELSRLHNDANVLALGARIIDEETAKESVRMFLTTDFAGGRHIQRVSKLSKRN